MDLSIGVFCLTVCGVFFDRALCFVHLPVNPVWPSGSYALPMSDTGCPEGNGFTWYTGHRTQELENEQNLNECSTSNHLKAKVGKPDITRYFCVKNTTDTDEGRPKWPDGKYCIYKKGHSCPQGFHEGYVLWDDSNGDSGSNRNSKSGLLPEGVYNWDTLIYFCCKVTGSVMKRVSLPVNKPFYLLAFESSTCQEVHGAVYSLENIVFDTENTNNGDARVYPYPYGADLKEPKIYYCYYRDCRWNVTHPIGTFSSPYFPQNYHDFQDCQWNITVPKNHVIQLQFEVFELESNPYSCGKDKCRCDYVEIKEESVTGDVTALGRYCMTNVPLDVIQSSTNKLIVTFHSDHAISAKGFNASYKAVLGIKDRIATTTRSTFATSKNLHSLRRIPISRSTTQHPTSGTEEKKNRTTNTKAEHEGQSSGVLEPTSRGIMGLTLKYIIIAFGAFVVVVTGVLCLTCKLCKRRNRSFMKRTQQSNLFESVIYSSMTTSSGSSAPSIKMYGDSELNEHFLKEKLIDNPIYHKRNIKSNCLCLDEQKSKDSDNPPWETSGKTENLLLSDNPLYESYDRSKSGEARTENPLYEQHIRQQ